jgi:predicted RNA-binding Zn-ribbon protein involved in translation (DUF1610 family)
MSAYPERPCPSCGATLELIDHYGDPPPIPMRVASAVHDGDGGSLDECPECGEPIDADALLGNPPMPPRRPRPVKTPGQREIDRELRESEERFASPDPFVRYAEARRLKG